MPSLHTHHFIYFLELFFNKKTTKPLNYNRCAFLIHACLARKGT